MAKAKLIVALFGISAALSIFGVTRLQREEDVLVFLPERDADVQRFREVSERFGSTRVALIGVTAAAGSDILTAEALDKIGRATDAARDVGGVDRVLSLTNALDVVAGPAGAEVPPLISSPPRDETAHRALREKVLSRNQIVQNLISRDGRAALILVFLSPGAGASTLHELKRETARALTGLDVVFGGAPFAGQSIYDEAERDVRALSPIALAILFIVVVVAFRDPVGVGLTLFSVGWATLLVIGAMGFLGVRFTVASATLPVILFASGSSYAIHVLGRYYLERQNAPAEDSLARALSIVSAPLAVAAGTTAVGFFAFIATDVKPMRAFGIACGVGVLACYFAAIVFVPAVLKLWPRPPSKPLSLTLLGRWLDKLWMWAAERRVAVIVIVLGTALASLLPMRKVTVRMDPRAFFRRGSDAWRAQTFLDDKFGGSRFMEVEVSADLDDPASLRELERLSDFVRSLPDVRQVSSVIEPLALVNRAMSGAEIIPRTRAQASNLYFFLEGQPGLRSLIAPGRRDALVIARYAGDGKELLERIENFVAHDLHRDPEWPHTTEIIDRLRWLSASLLGVEASGDNVRRELQLAVAAAQLPSDLDAAWRERRIKLVDDFFASEELPLLRDADRVKALAEEGAVDLHGQIVTHSPSREEGELAFADLSGRIDQARRYFAVEQLIPNVVDRLGIAGAFGIDPTVRKRAELILDDLFPPPESESGRAKQPISATVSGEPTLDRGFSRSVAHNQNLSLLIAVILVLALMLRLFRSFKLALLSMVPALATLAILFGVLGLTGRSIDLGTSLVAGIATGAGSDFAMHYLWYLRGRSASEVSRTVGPVMVVGVAIVALGFVTLAFGRSPVMQLFGTLAGAAMALSALLTCLLLPAFLGKADLPAGNILR